MPIRLSVDSVRDPNTLVQALFNATRNMPEIIWFDVLFPASFTPLSVYHKLGRVPFGVVADGLVDAVVWAEPDDRRQWSKERAVVRCNAENVTMRVGLLV
jgi:hypothetical protein